jgi:hypothetical protein
MEEPPTTVGQIHAADVGQFLEPYSSEFPMKRRLCTLPVLAGPITSTTFSIECAHPNFVDATLEFGAGDHVRCKLVRLLGPDEAKARQRMIAVERVNS